MVLLPLYEQDGKKRGQTGIMAGKTHAVKSPPSGGITNERLVRLFEFGGEPPENCREGPPWPSVNWEWASFAMLRNATEGVPYRTQIIELEMIDIEAPGRATRIIRGCAS